MNKLIFCRFTFTFSLSLSLIIIITITIIITTSTSALRCVRYASTARGCPHPHRGGGTHSPYRLFPPHWGVGWGGGEEGWNEYGEVRRRGEERKGKERKGKGRNECGEVKRRGEEGRRIHTL